MSPEITLEEVTALLLDKFEDKGGDRLPPTAYNKLLHFVEKRFDEHEVESDLPLFWYMFGPVAAIGGSDVSIQTIGDGRKVTCELSTCEVSASETAIREAEQGIEEGLEIYFDQGLDGLIRASYGDAPYEVQRVFLDLKAQIETESDQEQCSLGEFTSPENDQIRELVYDFIDEFPVSDFPDCEGELYKWYRLLSYELDMDEPDYEFAQKVTGKFWRLFCLELACRENTGVSESLIRAELPGVSGSIEDEQQSLRNWLLQKEQNLSRRNARNYPAAKKAADLTIAPKLGVSIDL